MSASETFEALSKTKDYRIVANSTTSGFYLNLNHKAAPTDDIHTRRAAYLPAPEFNLEKAKAEFKQPKYASGGKMPLVHSYMQSLQFEEEIGLLLKAALDEVGLNVELQPEPWNRIAELASKPETMPTMTQIFNGPTIPSPNSMFFAQYHSKGAGIWSSVSWARTTEFDALMTRRAGRRTSPIRTRSTRSCRRSSSPTSPTSTC
jgi:peptide/nickel transport system substrate-binding protein